MSGNRPCFIYRPILRDEDDVPLYDSEKIDKIFGAVSRHCEKGTISAMAKNAQAVEGDMNVVRNNPLHWDEHGEMILDIDGDHDVMPALVDDSSEEDQAMYQPPLRKIYKKYW